MWGMVNQKWKIEYSLFTIFLFEDETLEKTFDNN